jgi:hypothetical protein
VMAQIVSSKYKGPFTVILVRVQANKNKPIMLIFLPEITRARAAGLM